MRTMVASNHGHATNGKMIKGSGSLVHRFFTLNAMHDNLLQAWTAESLREQCSVADLTVVTRLTLPNIDTRQGSCAPIGQLLLNLHNLQLMGTVPSIRDLGTHFRNLTTLTLTRVDLVDLDGIHAFPALRELLISHNLIHDLSPLAFVDSLRVLDLGYNRIANWNQIYELSALDGLRTLNLVGNPIAVAGFESKAVTILPSLRTLNEAPVSTLLLRPSSSALPLSLNPTSPINTRITSGTDSAATVTTPVRPVDQPHLCQPLDEQGNDDVEDKLAALYLSTLRSQGVGPTTQNVTLALKSSATTESLPARPAVAMPLAHVDLPIPRAPLESGSTRARRLSRSLSPERNQILNLALTRLPPLDNALTPKPPPCLEPTDPCQLIMRDAPVLAASSTPKSGALHSPVSLPNAVAHEKLGAPVRPSQARPPPASSANGSASGARFRRFSAPTAANNSRPVELANTGAVRRDRESA